jgi:hypothetical protein
MTVVVRVAQVACGPSAARWGFRSRLVADAFGAPVLRDQGPDRPAGHGKADLSPRLTAEVSCPSSLRVDAHRGVRQLRPVAGRVEVNRYDRTGGVIRGANL